MPRGKAVLRPDGGTSKQVVPPKLSDIEFSAPVVPGGIKDLITMNHPTTVTKAKFINEKIVASRTKAVAGQADILLFDTSKKTNKPKQDDKPEGILRGHTSDG